MKILIAEDDPVSRRLLEAKLVKWGYDVIAIKDGNEAWEALRSGDPPALAILDIMMPGIDGIEICRRMKKDAALSDIPVLFISALFETEEKLKAFDAGGVDYITKPFAEREVLARVRTHLSLAAAKEGLLRINLDLTQEIEARRKAEQTLRETEEHYRAVVEDQTEVISRFLPDGTFTFVNGVLCRFFGKRAGELIGSRWQPTALPEDIPMIEESLRSISTANPVVTIENRVISSTGEMRWMQFVNRGLFDDNGHLLEIQAVGRDITEHKRSEERLRESEELLRITLENIQDPVFITDDKGAFTFICGNVLFILGYTVKEVQVMGNISKLFGKELFDLETLEAQGEIRNIECVIFKKDGERCDYLVNVKRVSIGSGTILYVCHDITEYKRAEQLNAHLASIVKSSEDAITTKSLEGVITSWNSGAERIYGYSAAEIVGRPVSILIPPELSEEFHSFLEKARRGESLYRQETVRMRKDGRRIDVALSISPIRDKRGEIIEISTIARDVSEQKRAEDELLRMNAYNRSLFEVSLDPLVTIGPDGLITDANAATTEVTGLKWGELIGSDFSDYFTDPKSARNGYKKVFKDGYVRDYPLEIRHRDGHSTPVLYNASLYRDTDGKAIGVFAAAHDIAEQKRAEEQQKKLEAQLQQAQKMEAIGLMAGSIAHDFNNILTAIIGYADLIVMSENADVPLRQHAEQIYLAAERAAELTRGLLAFSRKQVLQMRPADVGSIVREIERMLSRLVPEDISCRTTFYDKELIVMADKGQIAQVLMNLVTNAKDAMPKGGTLAIETLHAALDESFVNTHGFGEPGRYACISVKDSGIGMDEETRKRIFEPFFTTKELGKGTGLGMSIVYGIVKQHNGFITVESRPGEGTTFNVYLSLIGDASESMDAAQRMKPSPKGTETILLVEDDEHVRAIQKKIFENTGYTVITAVDGREAIDRFMEHMAEFDIIITDVVMPNMGGKQLIEEIRKVRPAVKVLFLSGYTRGIEIERDIPEDEFNFMAKPVAPSELLKKVREILDSV